MISPYAFPGFIPEDSRKQHIASVFWVKLITDVVCEYYKSDQIIIRGKSRKPDAVKARRVICYILRCREVGLRQIANHFGFDHATTIYHCRIVKNMIDCKDEVIDEIRDINEIINNKLTNYN